ncbi:MAG: hypothetical protein P4L67_05270 [Candidatus Pacebacteria bacterium]|nr:hypothetical protein [Candidatus Paceibacterota bacterium]
MKKIPDKETANSVFVSVFQNIKAFMKEKRDLLHAKLTDLGLAVPLPTEVHKPYVRRRRHSADSIYEYTEDVQEVPVNPLSNLCGTSPVPPNCILRQFHEMPEQYMQFLVQVCNAYRELVEVTSAGIEAICQQILSRCQASNDVTGYDIHKSLFYDYVIKDSLVAVSISRKIVF